MEKDLMELVDGCGVAKREKTDTGKVTAAAETARLLSSLGFSTAARSVEKKLNPIIKKAEIAANGYIEITPAKIQEFLNRRAADYNNAAALKKKKSTGTNVDIASATMAQLRGLYNSLHNGGNVVSNYSTENPQYWTTTNTTISNAVDSTVASLSAQMNQHLNNSIFGIGQAMPQQQLSGATLNFTRYDEPTPAAESFFAKTVDFSTAYEGTIGRFEWTEVMVENYAGIPPLKVLKKFGSEKAKNVFDYFTVASVNAVRDPLLLGRIKDSTSRYFIDQWGDDVALDDVI